MGILGKLLSRRAESGMLAIQVKEDGCCAALVARSADGKPRLVWYEETESADRQTLNRLARHCDGRKQRCTVLMPRSDYQVLLVEAPQVEGHELKAAMRWRIKDMIDYHVDDAALDVLEIPIERNVPARHYMLAVAAHAGQVQNLVRRMELARVPVSIIDIADIAQRNLAGLLEAPNEALAMLALTEEGGLLTVSCGGELYMTRRIELTLSAVRSADPETQRNFLERIVLEVRRSLDSFERQFRTLSLTKVLLGPLPEPLGLKAALQSGLDAPIEEFDVAGVLDCERTPALQDCAIQNRLLHCVGAALRLEENRL